MSRQDADALHYGWWVVALWSTLEHSAQLRERQGPLDSASDIVRAERYERRASAPAHSETAPLPQAQVHGVACSVQ